MLVYLCNLCCPFQNCQSVECLKREYQYILVCFARNRGTEESSVLLVFILEAFSYSTLCRYCLLHFSWILQHEPLLLQQARHTVSHQLEMEENVSGKKLFLFTLKVNRKSLNSCIAILRIELKSQIQPKWPNWQCRLASYSKGQHTVMKLRLQTLAYQISTS